MDPTVPAFRLRTMDELRSESVSRERLMTTLLATFAATALGLAALGTYGVVAFGMQQRRRELGIRLAIGAQTRDILGLVMRQALQYGAWGTLLGLGGAVAVGRMLASQLYETRAADPGSLAAAAGVLLAAVLAASLLPARQAIRVDPLEALRSD